eukprot:1769849-Amphidinium_carterae.1
MAKPIPQDITKSVLTNRFVALKREAACCKADRLAAMDLALIHGVMERTGAIIQICYHIA